MATRPSQSQARLFKSLLERYEPDIRRAFMASVADLQANINWNLLLGNLQAGDIEGAIDALNISPSAWRQYSSAMSTIYSGAGDATATQIVRMGASEIGIRFNMTNQRAERWIMSNVANRVVGFAEEAIKAARDVILAGYAQGQNPRTIAIDLAGRTTGAGGAREGGVLGLDAPRAERLQKVTQAMRTPEGVRSLVIKHEDGSLSLRYKVNKATANRILKAYNNGTEVPEADRAISERQYKNALLKDRADTIAETETANAVMAARDEQWRQLVESGKVSSDSVIKTWRHRRGASKYHRPDHLAMSGHEVSGLDTPFVFPDGAQLLYAHDPEAPARHIIRCGCDTEYRVNHRVGLQ